MRTNGARKITCIADEYRRDVGNARPQIVSGETFRGVAGCCVEASPAAGALLRKITSTSQINRHKDN